VAIFKWKTGQIVIAHCPNKYCRIEIEEIETGHPLTSRETTSADIFHSQLQVSPNGRWLISAGWVWQPFEIVSLYDLEAVARKPEVLDDPWNACPEGGWGDDIKTAAFINGDRVLLAGDNEDTEYTPLFHVYDLEAGKFVSKIQLADTPGLLMPVGDCVIGFWEHPKLIEISSGKIVQRWEDIDSGHRNGSFINKEDPHVPIAMDPFNKRFAVGSSDRITVIEFD
jgi:hypothetical protein